MRVLFIAANTERINMPAPPLGAAMVAAATRRCGHQVELIDLLGAEDPFRVISEAVETVQPQVIGISVRNIDDQNFAHPNFLLQKVENIVRVCRGVGNATIVLGGAGYSIFPAAALDYLGADLGIAGEGELAFPALLEAIENDENPSSLPGVYVRGGGSPGRCIRQVDLCNLPSPYPDLMQCLDPEDPELWVPVQTRRGCPFDCSYCSTPLIEGGTTRHRTSQVVVEELAGLAAAGFKRVHFVDNTFNLPSSYALDLCRRIASFEFPITWRCIVYPNKVSDELVDAMAAAGCSEVALGCESGCDRILKSLNKRFSCNDVKQVVTKFAAAGINRMGFLMLGVPGETRESVAESFEFADTVGLTSLKLQYGVRIYPETPLARLALEEGVVSAADDLLRPRFYMAPAVEGWVEDAAKSRVWSVPVWM